MAAASSRKAMKELKELIDLYKSLTELWDTRDPSYTDKDAKHRAWLAMSKKYRELDRNAIDIVDVKRKIDNLRTGWKREHYRVLRARQNFEEEHVPTLWYYEHMMFLEEVCHFNIVPAPAKAHRARNTSGSDDTSEDQLVTAVKRQKKSEPTILYVPEEPGDSENEIEYETISYEEPETIEHVVEYESNLSQMPQSNDNPAAQAYGIAIGLQLNDLEETQRTIAEKLIADVIFNARLKRLTTDSSITNSRVRLLRDDKGFTVYK